MSRPKRLNPNSFSHFITAQLFAGAHQGVFHRFGGAVPAAGRCKGRAADLAGSGPCRIRNAYGGFPRHLL